MKTAVILLLLVAPFYVSGQKSNFSNPSVADIVKAMAVANRYESSNVGFAGTPSEQYKRMVVLRQLASEDELLELTRHKNAAVRVYSFLALYGKGPRVVKSAYQRLANDTSAIFTLEGCIGGESTVGDIVRKYTSSIIGD